MRNKHYRQHQHQKCMLIVYVRLRRTYTCCQILKNTCVALGLEMQERQDRLREAQERYVQQQRVLQQLETSEQRRQQEESQAAQRTKEVLAEGNQQRQQLEAERAQVDKELEQQAKAAGMHW